jgi:hypothetical protein
MCFIFRRCHGEGAGPGAWHLEKLAPQEFVPLASISFCFSNHSKIIMTDTVGYIGSANYSDESANDWESERKPRRWNQRPRPLYRHNRR